MVRGRVSPAADLDGLDAVEAAAGLATGRAFCGESKNNELSVDREVWESSRACSSLLSKILREQRAILLVVAEAMATSHKALFMDCLSSTSLKGPMSISS